MAETSQEQYNHNIASLVKIVAIKRGKYDEGA